MDYARDQGGKRGGKGKGEGWNVSTTPNMAMGCRQCLSLSVVQLKGKHCKKPHCCNGIVDTFGHYVQLETPTVQSLY